MSVVEPFLGYPRPRRGPLTTKHIRPGWTPGLGHVGEQSAEYVVVAYHPVNNRISFYVSDNEGLLGTMSFSERPDDLYEHTLDW